MKILDKALGWIGRKIFAATQRDHTGWFVDWAQGGSATLSGQVVNNDKAFQLSTVFGCIHNISEDVGKVPFKVYGRLKPKGKDPLPDHRVYKLLHDQPNPEMTAMTFRQTLTGHALGWGNAFAEIERDIEGYPLYLWPLRPDRVRVFRLEDNRIWYEITTEDGQTAWLRDDAVFHIHGLGFDGLVGYNVIRYARECLGAALATQKTASALFGNAIRSSGTLEHPGHLSPEAQKSLRKSFDQYKGAENANRLMILEEGLKFSATTIPPEEAQFLETRQFTVAEICRWFRMPPNKMADTTRAQGWSTLEQTNTDYVVDTLLPWFVRWEQEVWRKLLMPREQRKGLFARHVVQGLLRGDIKARKDYYVAGRNWGWLSADDIRELEDMNPLPDGFGEAYIIPLNTKELGEEPEEPAPFEGEKAFNSLIDDAASRLTMAEIRSIDQVIHKAKEDREKFNKWIEGFYQKHATFATKTLMPLANIWWEQGGDFYIEAIVDQMTREAVNAFAQDDPEKVLMAWRENRKDSLVTLIKGGMKHAVAKTE